MLNKKLFLYVISIIALHKHLDIQGVSSFNVTNNVPLTGTQIMSVNIGCPGQPNDPPGETISFTGLGTQSMGLPASPTPCTTNAAWSDLSTTMATLPSGQNLSNLFAYFMDPQDGT